MTHSDVPYYHSNINENLEEIVRLITDLLNRYSQPNVVNVNNETGTSRKVHWVYLNTEYKLEQFTNETATKYGNHLMLTTAVTYDDEQDIHTRVYDRGADGKITEVKHTIALTDQHKKEHDEWWEKNKRKNGNIWFAVPQSTTSGISQEKEMIIYELEQAEEHIKK